MLKKTREVVMTEINEIILDLIDDPKFCIEDISATIYEKVFVPYQTDLLAHFAVPADTTLQEKRNVLRP